MFSKRKDKQYQEFCDQAVEYLDALYGTALRLTSAPARAEDLVQDTYVRALRFRDRFDPGTNLKAWMFRIMFNLFINQIRREKRGRQIKEGHEQPDMLQRMLPDEHMAPTSRPEEYFFEKMFSDEVIRALSELTSDFKMVVLLADVNGFSYKQISDILGIPVGTVMSRLHRGRRALRDKLHAFALAEGYIRQDSEESESEPPADLEAYRRRKRAGREEE